MGSIFRKLQQKQINPHTMKSTYCLKEIYKGKEIYKEKIYFIGGLFYKGQKT